MAQRRDHEESVFNPAKLPAPIIENNHGEEEHTTLLQGRLERGYWSELFWSLLFPSTTQNLITFLTLWGVYGFLTCLPLPRFYFLIIFWAAVWFWWIAFRIEVIEAAATGVFRLPDVEVSGNILVDLLDPAMRWCGSWLVVLLPALTYAIMQGYGGVNVIWDSYQAIVNPPLPGTRGPVIDALLATLTILGLFFWPLVLLIILFGGFGSLWRIDLLLVSLGNTLFAYLLTVLLVACSYAGLLLSDWYLSPSLGAMFTASTAGGLFAAVLQRVLVAGIELYAGIFMARVIGLYFRHFGHRLAWDWGQNLE